MCCNYLLTLRKMYSMLKNVVCWLSQFLLAHAFLSYSPKVEQFQCSCNVCKWYHCFWKIEKWTWYCASKLLEAVHIVNLKLSKQKIEFKKTLHKYLGHIVSNQEIATNSEKIRATQPFPVPLLRCLCYNLTKLCKTLSNKHMRVPNSPNNKFLKPKETIQNKIFVLQMGIDWTCTFRGHQGNSMEHINNLQNYIFNSTEHIFVEHSECASYFCDGCLKDNEENI